MSVNNSKQQVNHLIHLEDTIFEPDKGGLFFRHLQDVVHFVAGVQGSPLRFTSISTKWDGAPSFVAGWDATKHEYFVGTKSVFNKRKPIRCHSIHDIWCQYGHDEKYTTLIPKLEELLRYIRYFGNKTGYHGIFQGDFLFLDPNYQYDNGKYRMRFKPNTLEYTFTMENYYFLGIVIHTEYDQNLKPFDGLNNLLFEVNKAGILVIDPRLKVEPILTPDLITHYLDRIYELEEYYFKQLILMPAWQKLVDSPEERAELNKRINNCISKNMGTHWLIHPCMIFYQNVMELKDELIDILDYIANRPNVEIVGPDGFTTNHEGFVKHLSFWNWNTDQQESIRIKLVKRFEFSRMNILNKQKGWEK